MSGLKRVVWILALILETGAVYRRTPPPEERNLSTEDVKQIPTPATSQKKKNCAGVQPGEKILVVGAGFAGLTAAREILNDTAHIPRIKLVILEAEDGIGGRARSRDHSFFEGRRQFTGVCYGAYWLTGSDGPRSADGLNPTNGAAHELAVRAGVKDSDVVDRVNWHTPKNHTYVPLEHNERLSGKWQAFKKACTGVADPVWYAAGAGRNTKTFDASLQKKVRDEMGLSYKEFWTLFHDYNGQISGVPPEETWAGAYYEGVTATNQQILKNGFAPLYDYLRSDILKLVRNKNKNYDKSDETKVQFKMNHRVTKVQKMKSGKKRVLVKMSDDTPKKFAADKIVVTVGINVLKSLKFAPKLPSKHTNALSAIGMGHNSKTILFYKTRFWNKQIPRTVRSQKIVFVTGIKNTVNGFSKIWTHPTQNFVMLIKHGDAAIECESSPQTCADEARNFMRKAFGPSTPTPIAVTNSDWSKNPSYGGAWSYLTTGHIKTSDKSPVPSSYLRDLPRIWNTSGGYSLDRLTIGRSPEGDWKDGGLFFAGEATSLTVPGYVHGAIESGERVAIDVCQN